MVTKSRIRRKIRRLERGATDTETTAAIDAAVGWTLADSWTYSTNVTEVDFISLDAYSELMVLVNGITLGTLGVASLRVSADNGSNFLATSGDYNSIDIDGIKTAAARINMYATNATAARTAYFSVKAWNSANIKPGLSSRSDAVFWTLENNAAVALNAIRIIPSAGGNITGGSILVYGR